MGAWLAVINWGDWASKLQIAGYVSAVTITVGGFAYRRLRAELHPNHGSSLRDASDRIESRQNEFHVDILKVRHLIEKHEAYHDGLNDQ